MTDTLDELFAWAINELQVEMDQSEEEIGWSSVAIDSERFKPRALKVLGDFLHKFENFRARAKGEGGQGKEAPDHRIRRKTDDEYLLESGWWEERQGDWPKDWLAVRKLAIAFAKEQAEPLYNYIDSLRVAEASVPQPPATSFKRGTCDVHPGIHAFDSNSCLCWKFEIPAPGSSVPEATKEDK